MLNANAMSVKTLNLSLHYIKNSISYLQERVYNVNTPKQDANFVVFNIPAGFVLLMMLYTAF